MGSGTPASAETVGNRSMPVLGTIGKSEWDSQIPVGLQPGQSERKSEWDSHIPQWDSSLFDWLRGGATAETELALAPRLLVQHAVTAHRSLETAHSRPPAAVQELRIRIDQKGATPVPAVRRHCQHSASPHCENNRHHDADS